MGFRSLASAKVTRILLPFIIVAPWFLFLHLSSGAPDVLDYVQGLLWCLEMYVNGKCPDYLYAYGTRAPSGLDIRQFLMSGPRCVVLQQFFSILGLCGRSRATCRVRVVWSYSHFSILGLCGHHGLEKELLELIVLAFVLELWRGRDGVKTFPLKPSLPPLLPTPQRTWCRFI